MTSSQIKCFLAVAECGSFSEAARQLFVAQPAVSKQIRALEADLNLRLFRREIQSVSLTTQGEIIYQALRHCEDVFSEALLEARQSEVEIKPSVIQMGCPLFWNTDAIYTPICNWLKQKHGSMELSLNAYTQKYILAQLHDGSIDVAIHTEDAVHHPGLVTRHFASVNAILLFSRNSAMVSADFLAEAAKDCTLLTSFDITAPLYSELLELITHYLGVETIKCELLDNISMVYANLEDPRKMFLASDLFLWKNDPLLRYLQLPIPRKIFVTHRKEETRPEVVRFADMLCREFSRFYKYNTKS